MKFSTAYNLSLLVAGSLPLLGWAGKPVEEAPSWTLKQISRTLTSDDEVWLGFLITSEGYDSQWCYQLVNVISPSSKAQWVDQPCVGSDFSTSWGYKDENDVGILVVRHLDTSRVAWFGWNGINQSNALSDVGPNATKLLREGASNDDESTEEDSKAKAQKADAEPKAQKADAEPNDAEVKRQRAEIEPDDTVAKEGVAFIA
ncbi:hypothetical protein XA68_14558 [Ophiocordyceps unilateralis]|uniref:Uncharacterized protein n=1 Tax=Ophiocordyceps unilateralis TaxID=268505 RepID=A0A2A9P9A4_OPHUN|nr:hypothetical protein XA68_14558 [Ophiocordyceps unilateralis]